MHFCCHTQDAFFLWKAAPNKLCCLHLLRCAHLLLPARARQAQQPWAPVPPSPSPADAGGALGWTKLLLWVRASLSQPCWAHPRAREQESQTVTISCGTAQGQHWDTNTEPDSKTAQKPGLLGMALLSCPSIQTTSAATRAGVTESRNIPGTATLQQRELNN